MKPHLSFTQNPGQCQIFVNILPLTRSTSLWESQFMNSIIKGHFLQYHYSIVYLLIIKNYITFILKLSTLTIKHHPLSH